MSVRLLAVVGPTASGKSALGIRLAERVAAEIVCADARQVYRGLDVGTAKPSSAERARVPHHCLDLVEPTEDFDVARWVETADAAIATAAARGRPIVVVGGTGLYVRVLLGGLCDAVPRRLDLRAALAGVGAERLRRWIERLDPTAAARIHPNDRVRTERALEVVLSAGVPLSRLQGAHGFEARRYDARVLVLAREPAALDERIARRVDEMLAAGWCDEVRGLAARLPEEAPAWRTLGYRELRAYVRGAGRLDAARAAITRATRRFAKRQRTWWRREAGRPGVVFLDPRDGDEAVLDEAAAFLVANGQAAR